MRNIILVCISVFLFFLVACNNKANIEESLFEDGQKVSQYYYKGINGEEENSEEIEAIREKFKEMEEKKKFKSEKEELFVSDMVLLSTLYQLYSITKATEEMSGDDYGSSEKKERIENHLKIVKDRFGIAYDK